VNGLAVEVSRTINKALGLKVKDLRFEIWGLRV